jgi:hypothetical protein
MKATRSLAASVLMIALWLSFAPRAAFGQGSTWAGVGLARMVETAMWKAGSLRVNADLEIRDAGYDSDIYYGFAGYSVPDGTIATSFPFQLLFSLNKTVVLDFFDIPRYDFYLDTKSERAWNNTFHGQIHFALAKVYLRLGGGYANNRQRLSQELYVNIREKTSRLDAFALWQASRAASFAVVFDRVNFDYGNAEFGGMDLAETLNRRVDSLEFVTFLQPDPRFRFFLDGQYGDYVFTAVSSQFKNTRSYALFGGFVSIIQEDSPDRTGRIVGSARLGYMKFDVRDIGQIDGSGLVGDVDLTAGIFRLTTARIFYSKGFQFSVFSGATFFVDQSYGIGINRSFSRRTSLSYDLTFGQNSYPRAAADGEAFSGVLYRFTTHRMSLSKTLSRYLRISLTGTLGRRVTAETGQAWKRYLIGVSLDFGTPINPISTPIGGLLRSSPEFGN